MDPKANKYYSLSPYDYVADNPLKFIDPDGKEIVFVVRDNKGNITNQLTYSNGNFKYQNGNVYNPKQGSISSALDKTLAAYNKIETSGDKVLIGKLHTLERSDNYHYVQEGNTSGVNPYGESKNEANRKAENGEPVGTSTYLDFSQKSKDVFKKVEGVEESDLAIVSHELQHQFDNDQGTNADDTGQHNADNPAEIRAVKNENRGRAIERINRRTTYGGEKIDPSKLE